MQVQRVQNNPKPQQSFGMFEKPTEEAISVLNGKIVDLVSNGQKEKADCLIKSFEKIKTMLKECKDVHFSIRHFEDAEEVEHAVPVVGPYFSNSNYYAGPFTAMLAGNPAEMIEIRAKAWTEGASELEERTFKVTMPTAEDAINAVREIKEAANEFVRGAVVSRVLDEEVIRARKADEALKQEINKYQNQMRHVFDELA